jgi:putative transposase
MPRTARIVVPNTPHHVIQRGHNRHTVFVHDQDYRYYLENLFEWKAQLGCRLYGWCLMTNHVHLLLDPGDDPANLGLLMKRVAGRQTRYVNALERRTGSLWEGRYKSSPVETDTYLLACARYIELNPVRAHMVAAPQDYPWSSYRAKTGETQTPAPDPDPAYLALGPSPARRQARYRDWVASAVPEKEWQRIRTAVQSGDITGSDRFRQEIETRLHLRLERKQRGRPRKQKTRNENKELAQ